MSGAYVGAGTGQELFLTYQSADGGEGGGDVALLKRLNQTDAMGLELSPGLNATEAAMAELRVSMSLNLSGGVVRLGASQSTIFFEGVVEGACPLLFNGGEDDGNRTRVCLDRPTQERRVSVDHVSSILSILTLSSEWMGALE